MNKTERLQETGKVKSDDDGKLKRRAEQRAKRRAPILLMMANNAEDVNFLLGTKFSKALFVPASRIALARNTKWWKVVQDFCRYVAVKAFACDTEGDKIEATPLNK